MWDNSQNTKHSKLYLVLDIPFFFHTLFFLSLSLRFEMLFLANSKRVGLLTVPFHHTFPGGLITLHTLNHLTQSTFAHLQCDLTTHMWPQQFSCAIKVRMTHRDSKACWCVMNEMSTVSCLVHLDMGERWMNDWITNAWRDMLSSSQDWCTFL